MDNNNFLYIAIAVCSFLMSIIALVVYITVFAPMSKKIDKLEELLIKYNSKENFENSKFKLDLVGEKKDFYDEFLKLVPSNYKEKMTCSYVTTKMLSCVFAQLLRDKVIDEDTSISLIMLMTWMQNDDPSMIYDSKTKMITGKDKQYMIQTYGKNPISYDEFKNELIKHLKLFESKIANYPNRDCPCDAIAILK